MREKNRKRGELENLWEEEENLKQRKRWMGRVSENKRALMRLIEQKEKIIENKLENGEWKKRIRSKESENKGEQERIERVRKKRGRGEIQREREIFLVNYSLFS